MTKAEQKAIAAELAKLTLLGGGVLTPHAVVGAAKDPLSAMHAQFTWDDDEAADAWRLDQARQLIRSVKVNFTVEHRVVSTVGYVRNPDADFNKQGYVATASLVGDNERSREVLVTEFTRASAALRRAKELSAVFGVEQEVDYAVTYVDKLSEKVTS